MQLADSVVGGISAADELVAEIRRELRAVADPVRAPQMQAYMKSAMPYLGIPVPVTRKLARKAAVARPPADLEELIRATTQLWRSAEFREELYAATALAGLRLASGRLEMLPVYREMIVTGAWWDHVDAVSHLVGAVLLAHPTELRALLGDWSTDPDRWLRRTSIISQLCFKDRTDTGLLAAVITPNLPDREFFVRKAIGWALRDYARTDPEWVRQFVELHSAQISPLSRREALKHLG
ncbi:MAG: DNA alkylation repair protein [Nakamurella sp.]